MDVRKFINCVKAREEVYNRSNGNYKHRGAMIDAWRGISREMNMNVIDCKEKWHNLRSNYMRERKKVIGPGAKKWHLLDALSFLEPHHCIRISVAQSIRNRNKRPIQEESFIIQELNDLEMPTINQNTNALVHDELGEQVQHEIQHEIHKHDSNSNQNIEIPMDRINPVQVLEIESPKQKRRRKISKKRNSDDIDSEYLREVRKLARHLSQPSEDHDRMFLLSLLPMVKQLTPLESINFRVEVQQLLQRKLYPKYDL